MLAVQAGISQMTTPREESAKLVEKFTHIWSGRRSVWKHGYAQPLRRPATNRPKIATAKGGRRLVLTPIELIEKVNSARAAFDAASKSRSLQALITPTPSATCIRRYRAKFWRAMALSSSVRGNRCDEA